jgi:hypothetical protein
MLHRVAGLIPLDPAFLHGTDSDRVAARLERIVRASGFEIVHESCGFRILGPAVPYHAIDPFLPAGLARLRPDLRTADAQSFRTQTSAFDLCLEDSWSGYFVAEWLCRSPGAEDLVFVHLDHHTDLMSSLLERRGDALIDPTDAQLFDPCSSADWQKGIASGSVGIGSFVTTLFELPNRLHVRHINNYTTSDYFTYHVIRATRTYAEIPGRAFAAIRKRREAPLASVGTYKGGCAAARVLEALPSGRVVVHIDLDYLINDFNGNRCDPAWSPSPEARTVATRKLDAFFAALSAAGRPVERWIVATSPGFCSAYHWEWLLARIAQGIEQVCAVTAGTAFASVHGGVPTPQGAR